MKTSYCGAACALSLTLLASTVVATAQDSAPAITITQIAPDPGTPAPRIVVPAQTEALKNALKKNDWDAATLAITNGASVNDTDKNGVTALMLAAQERKPSVVQLLLDSGADPNALDKKGRSALHYAIPPDPKPKKKFGIGNVLGAMGAVGNLPGGLGKISGMNSLLGGGGLDQLLGNNLTQLLGGQSFSPGSKSNWMAIAGSALLGDKTGDLGIGRLLTGTGELKLGAGDWVGLLSSVKGNNARVLGAMGNLGAGDSAKSALWNQFLGAASSGNNAGVAALMGNADLAPLLGQAVQGLTLARGELPGNATRSIIGALTGRGLNLNTPDKGGKTAMQLATERGLTELLSQ